MLWEELAMVLLCPVQLADGWIRAYSGYVTTLKVGCWLRMIYPFQKYSYKFVCANVGLEHCFVLWTLYLVTNHYQRLGSTKNLGEWYINLKSHPLGRIALMSHLLGVSSIKSIQCWTGNACSDWYAMTWYDYPRGEFYFTTGANSAKQVSQVEILHHNHPTISDTLKEYTPALQKTWGVDKLAARRLFVVRCSHVCHGKNVNFFSTL